MRVLVPFAAERPKTRLATVLEPDERAAFARAMLRDVLAAVAATDRDPTVLATAPVDCAAPVTVDERPLTAAVNGVLPSENDDDPVAVVMADLALATPAAIERLFDPEADVVLAPGRGGGTNALVARHPDFRVDYHGASIRDHREAARSVGASLATVDSFRLATDVDEPDDLVEVLLHAGHSDRRGGPDDGHSERSDGPDDERGGLDDERDGPRSEAVTWLRERGFELATTGGRVDVRRSQDRS